MGKLIGFGMKSSLPLPSLDRKYFNNLKNDNDEPIYTYNDEFMRHSVRKSCSIFYQCFQSSFADNVFDVLSQDLNVQGNICKIIEIY